MIILYNKEIKLITIVNARCFSKTIINLYSKLNNVTCKTHSEYASNKNICLNSYKPEFILKNFKDYKVVIIVRNPYERILSDTIAHQVHAEYSFKEFIDKYINNLHIIATPTLLFYLKNFNCEIINFDDMPNKFNKILIDNKLSIIPEKKKYNCLSKIRTGWKTKDITNDLTKKKIEKEIELKDDDVNLVKIFNTRKFYNIKLGYFINNIPRGKNLKYFYNKEIINKVYNRFKARI